MLQGFPRLRVLECGMMERFLLSMRQFLSRSSLLSAAAAAGERGAYRLTQLALSLRKERAGRETGREEEEAGTVELLPILFLKSISNT